MWKCNVCGAEINPPKFKCPKCNGITGITSNVVVSFEDEKFLEKRYQKCKEDCDEEKKKKLKKFVKIFKDNLSISINLHSGSLINFLQNERIPYLNLYDNIKAKVEYDPELIAKRRAMDNLLFGKDCENLIHSAINLGNIGLVSYGAACIFLKLDENVKKNTSFIEQNSFDYINSSSTATNITIPPGIRALWNTVHKLAVVKHQKELKNNSNLSYKELSNLILFSDGEKKNDRFIEALILQPITRKSVSRIIYSPYHDRIINAKGLLGKTEKHNRKILEDLSNSAEKLISSQIELFLPEVTFEVVDN